MYPLHVYNLRNNFYSVLLFALCNSNKKAEKIMNVCIVFGCDESLDIKSVVCNIKLVI